LEAEIQDLESEVACLKKALDESLNAKAALEVNLSSFS